MNSQINIYGKKTNGEVKFSNIKGLEQWIKMLDEGEEIVAKFNRQKDYKSNRQIRLCYACLREIMSKTGSDLSEVKYHMKKTQGLCAVHEIDGDKVMFCKSLSDFNKIEMSEFIMRMNEWSMTNLNHQLLSNDDINFLKI